LKATAAPGTVGGVSGILDGLLGRGAGGRGPAEPIIEVLLMAGLADGEATPAMFDRIARVVRDLPRLQSADWDWVLHRAEELLLEAPLFFDARAGVLDALTDPPDQRLALGLAAKIVGGGRELPDETRAVLGALGRGFGLSDAELELLLSPAGVVATVDLGFVRSRFNDPRAAPTRGLFESLRAADDDVERRLLLFKLTAARRLAWTWGREPEVRIVTLGQPLNVDGGRLRVDAVVEREGRRNLARCVAAGEALHRAEHPLWRALTERLPETARVLVVHDGPLSPEDESFVRSCDPARLATVQLATGVGGDAFPELSTSTLEWTSSLE